MHFETAILKELREHAVSASHGIVWEKPDVKLWLEKQLVLRRPFPCLPGSLQHSISIWHKPTHCHIEWFLTDVVVKYITWMSDINFYLVLISSSSVFRFQSFTNPVTFYKSANKMSHISRVANNHNVRNNISHHVISYRKVNVKSVNKMTLNFEAFLSRKCRKNLETALNTKSVVLSNKILYIICHIRNFKFYSHI